MGTTGTEFDESAAGDPLPETARHLATKRVTGRTSTATVFDNGDGTSTALVGAGALNWQDDDGRWRALDPRLRSAEAGRRRNGSAPFRLEVSEETGSPSGDVSVGMAGWRIGVTMSGSARVRGSFEGAKASHRSVAPGIDLETLSVTNGVKQNVVLHRRPPKNSFRFALSVDGVEARQAEEQVEFVDRAGTVVAVLPSGWAYDSSSELATASQRTPVSVRLVDGTSPPIVEVSVSAAWLNDPGRVFPVVVDPSIEVTRDFGHLTPTFDTFVNENTPNGTHNGWWDQGSGVYVNQAGRGNGFQYYTYMKYDLGLITGRQVLHGEWMGWFPYASNPNGTFALWQAAGPWSDSTLTWANQPGHLSERVLGGPLGFDYCPDNELCWYSRDVTSWVQGWVANPSTNHGLTMDTEGQNWYFKMAAAETSGTEVDSAIAVTFVNQQPTTPSGAEVAPASGSTVLDATPTLTAPAQTDAEGDDVYYWFRVATSADGEVGQAANSGWLTTPSWTVPEGALRDGVTYSWKVFTTDQWDWLPRNSSWPPSKLKVDLRLGSSTTSPTDTVGPVTVNLATGNLAATAATPSFPTAGGDVGLTFAYNSNAQPESFGLTGTYFTNPWLDGNPYMVRRDANVDFDWKTWSPAPGMPFDDFSVAWDGMFVPPVSAPDWQFGSVHDDGARIYVNGNLVLNTWEYWPGGPHWTSPFAVTAGVPVSIKVEYREGVGDASVQLRARHGGMTEQIAPSPWFRSSAPALPDGWSVGADLGGGVGYAGATVTSESVAFTSVEGATSEYRWNGSTWVPPADEDGVLARDADGGLLLDDGGMLYRFSKAGVLLEATQPADARKPAAPEYVWSGTPIRLRAIRDRVSGRQANLYYGSADCPTRFGTHPAPANMLCRIDWWDGTQTRLHYYAGMVIELENPGSASVAFGYTDGRLTGVRDLLQSDAIRHNNWSQHDTSRLTTIAYSDGRATSVTAAKATPSDPAAPAHTYDYRSATETWVHVAGLAEPNGFARKATFDAAGRSLTETDVSGLTTTKTWRPGNDDLIASVVAPGNMKSTTLYDHADRPTDSYGPAPASCFTGDTPNGTCAIPVPHTRTDYDSGLKGLSASYWANATMSGPPVAHSLGIDNVLGDVWRDWPGATAPTGVPFDWWSARLTGEIDVDTTRDIWVDVDDSAKVWIDDQLIVNAVCCGASPSGRFTPPRGPGRYRIRIDFTEGILDAQLHLWWKKTDGTGVQVVPGSRLHPRYDLATRSEVDDNDPAGSRITETRYDRPALGLATATTTDPGAGGLNLTTTTDYERPGQGFLRRVRRTLPAGESTYAATVAADNPHAWWRLDDDVTHWADPAFDDRDWPAATRLGAYGIPGWYNNVAGWSPNFGAQWLWDRTTAATSAPLGTTWFRKKYTATNDVNRLVLINVAADDAFNLYVDGERKLTGNAWNQTYGVNLDLSLGDHTIALEVTNAGGGPNPAGMMLSVHSRVQAIGTMTSADDGWKVRSYPTGSGHSDNAWATDEKDPYRASTYAAGLGSGAPGALTRDLNAAASFDGRGDHLDLGDGYANFAGGLTLEAWVYPTTSVPYQRIFDIGNGPEVDNLILARNGTTSDLAFHVGRGSTFRSLVAPGAIQLNTWQHFVATVATNGTATLYKNGTQIATGVSWLPNNVTRTGAYIGRSNYPTDPYFQGRIDEPAIYQTALSPAQVAAHRQAGTAAHAGTTSTYYGDTETRADPCPGGTSAIQAGALKLLTAADPDGAGPATPRTEEYVYNAAGRVVATRITGGAWRCTSYDSRGRPATTVIPAHGDATTTRTITYNYAVNGNPQITETSDTANAAAKLRTEVDLLGRAISSTDIHGHTSTAAYDQAGRATGTTTTPAGGTPYTLATTYDTNSRISGQLLDGATLATPTYDTATGELTSVSYPNGTGSAGNNTSMVFSRDVLRRVTGHTINLAGATVTDEVIRSQSGRVVDQTIDGSDARVGNPNFAYDEAGRLTHAWVPGHTLTYNYGDSTCPLAARAGRNTNRTSVTDNGATAVYCYDAADRLTSVTGDARYTAIAYDNPRGTTTTLGNETMGYDGADRHVVTTKAATTVRYVRDATDRIVERKVNGATVARYGHSSDGDTPDFTTNASGALLEQTIPLLGGVLWTDRTSGNDTWSYPNVHGDVIALADANGTKQGPTRTYDPYGQPLTTAADNSTGNYDYGWLGQHQRGVETEAGIATIEMGARPYVHGLGRFLQVDPVEGGSANDYDYANAEPCNNFDLDGRFPKPWNYFACKNASKAMAGYKARVTKWAVQYSNDFMDNRKGPRARPIDPSYVANLVKGSGYFHEYSRACGKAAADLFMVQWLPHLGQAVNARRAAQDARR